MTEKVFFIREQKRLIAETSTLISFEKHSMTMPLRSVNPEMTH